MTVKTEKKLPETEVTQCSAWSRCSLSVSCCPCFYPLTVCPVSSKLSPLMDQISAFPLMSALQAKLLSLSLFPDHLLACLPACFALTAVTDLSSPFAGSLGLSHSTTDTTNYLHALQHRKRRWGRGKKRGREVVPEGVCTCFLIGHAPNFPSLPLFSFKFSNLPLHISYSANENKHSSPPLPPPLSFFFLFLH